MLIVLFIVGPPGSGKSEAYRIICAYLQEQRIERINDYAILMGMCEEDKLQERFRPTKKYKGFMVTNPSAFDDALKKANQDIAEKIAQNEQMPGQNDLLLVIEFSRNNYYHAFHHLEESSLWNAYFLLLLTNKEISRERLKKRITIPPTEDNHYVPRDILRSYYDKSLPYSPNDLSKDFRVPIGHIEEIANNGSLDDFKNQIHHFVDTKIKQKVHT